MEVSSSPSVPGNASPSLVTHRLTPAVSTAISRCQASHLDADSKTASEACLLWLLSLAPDIDTDAKGKGRESDMVHWYCGKDGAKACWPAAVLAMRLLSFQRKGMIDQWRCRFEHLLESCCDCVREYQRAKAEYKKEYLVGVKSDAAISIFMDGIGALEVRMAIEHFAQIGITPSTPDNAALIPRPGSTLANIPTSVVYSILVNPVLFQQDSVIDLLSQCLPIDSYLPLPPIVSAGLLALILHPTSILRDWSRSQLRRCDLVTAKEYVTSNLADVITTHLQVAVSRDRNVEVVHQTLHLQYTNSQGHFWDGVNAMLSVLSADAIRDNLAKKNHLNVVRLIAGHLGDDASHLESVLASFTTLLEKLGSSLWSADDEHYVGVVLSSILDNVTFESMLVALPIESRSSAIFAWIPLFLSSMSTSSDQFTQSVATVSQTFLNRFQSDRFSITTRTITICQTLDIFTRIFLSDDTTAAASPTWTCADEASSTLNLHCEFIAQLAFSAPYRTKDWSIAAGAGRRFVQRMTMRDGRRILDSVYELGRLRCKALSETLSQPAGMDPAAAGGGTDGVKIKESPGTLIQIDKSCILPQSIAFSSELWNGAYKEIGDDDMRGIAILLAAIAPFAHLEAMSSSIWKCSQIRPQMRAFNHALVTVRSPILPLLMSLASERTDSLLEFLAQPGVSGHITALLFSPIEAVHNTAQGLVKDAFDVTTRRECFRSLLLKFPEATFKGISQSIQSFMRVTKTLPDACAMAKRLVRCLSDVIDALCGISDGLLRDESFQLRTKNVIVHKELASLWSKMCEGLAMIFEYSENWSIFYASNEMTEWMRDALLFGHEMRREASTFEQAISGSMISSASASSASTSPAATKPTLEASQASRRGQQMVSCLNGPLDALIVWLRLNDDELLTLSFDLVRSLLDRFSRAGMAVLPSIVFKLKKAIRREERKMQDPTSRASSLRFEQMRELLESLKSHDDSDGGSAGSESTRSGKELRVAKSTERGVGVASSSRRRIETISIDDDDDDVDDMEIVTLGSRSTSTSTLTLKKPASSHGQSTLSFPPDSSRLSSRPTGPPLHPPFPALSSQAKSKSLINFGQPAMRNAVRQKGVPWTTYSTATANTADSSSDSSADEEEGPKGLALLAKNQKSPKIKKPVEQRRVQMMEMDTGLGLQGNNRNGRSIVGNSTKDAVPRGVSARNRSAEDYSALHRKILQWDYNHNSDYPPDAPTAAPTIPTSFTSFDHHFSTFEPLLLLECWAQIRQARQELITESHPIACMISGRQSVDDFTDVFLTVDQAAMPERMHFGESDLVLLQQGSRTALAKVQSSGRKRTFLELTLRCHFGNDRSDASAGLYARTQWHILKLYTMSTIHREYAALKSLPFLELSSHILRPRPPPLAQLFDDKIRQTMKAYQVNEPQAMAILRSLKTRGFSLIQGPPGTGKTKTIVGLIGAFIASRPAPASEINVGRAAAVSSEPSGYVAKVLLCAPSNAAVDEVAKRLKDGIRRVDGSLYIPKIVRIGSDAAVDISVKDIFIDELVERAISGTSSSSTGPNSTSGQAKMQSMRADVDLLRSDRDMKKAELDGMHSNDGRKSELMAELRIIKSRIFDLSQQLDSEKDKAQQSRRALDAQQRKIRMQILSEADVICATLSGSGHDYMAQVPFDFSTVIIDEAAQSVELSSLIPLKYGCQRCILVGDPNQLPPTVLSRPATQAGYERSLFVRMMDFAGPESVHLLSIQYRMHSEISAFPSAAFYESRLTDGPDMDAKTRQPWHTSPLFPAYCFMHVKGGSEQQTRHRSLSNPQEASVAVAIYARMLKDFPAIDLNYRVGVVTPYKGQVMELKKQFRNCFGMDVLVKVSFNTVDGFQGQEKDIIILSCVRGGAEDKSVGFLADTRRMNVALTRARSSLFILGDANKLRSNRYWNNLVTDAQSRGLLKEVDLSTFNSPTPIASAGPPVIQRGVTSLAKSIMSAPFAALVTPKQLSSAQSAASTAKKNVPSAYPSSSSSTSATAPTPVGLKRRVSESMVKPPSSAEKRRKLDNDGMRKDRDTKTVAPRSSPVTASPTAPTMPVDHNTPNSISFVSATPNASTLNSEALLAMSKDLSTSATATPRPPTLPKMVSKKKPVSMFLPRKKAAINGSDKLPSSRP